MGSSLTRVERPELHPAAHASAEQDLAACEALLRAGSRSFWAASLLLPPWMRRRATAIYAFCRVADDAVDDGDASLATLAALERRVASVYAGKPQDHPVDRTLARVVEAHSLPRALLEALLDGFAWDLDGRRYETLADVRAYAARVAGAVGVILTVLMERRHEATLARAADLGVAMQLTNIARDVGEDARRGRVYLPERWLGEAGLSPMGLLRSPTFTPALGGVVARLLAVADELYARALTGIPALPWDTRVGMTAAARIYADIGRVIAANGHDSVSQRAVTSTGRKLWLAARSLPALAHTGPASDAPPLPETAWLVEAAADLRPLGGQGGLNRLQLAGRTGASR